MIIYILAELPRLVPGSESSLWKMYWSTIVSTAIAVATLSEASTLTPPVIPLIVRNPYLSTWLGHAREKPWEHWPIFWTGQELGLGVLAAVASTDTVYPLLGRPHDSLSDSDEKSVVQVLPLKQKIDFT